MNNTENPLVYCHREVIHMHEIRTAAGQRYFLSYPVFTDPGSDTANRFYETFAERTAEYFAGVTADDRCAVCRGMFSVEEEEDGFAVSFILTLRRGGRRYGVKELRHRWRRWDGRDATLRRG